MGNSKYLDGLSQDERNALVKQLSFDCLSPLQGGDNV